MEQPVGVFDSGVGGLTVLRELVRALPGERFVYLGDTARFPYGTKSRETVTRYAIEIANHLITRFDVKMLVAACNTVSTIALPTLRKIYKIPVVGMVDPCVRRAASLGKRSSIGVIGTAGTIRSTAYEQALKAAIPGVRVRSTACPLLVALAEEGWAGHPVTRQIVGHYLSEFLDDPPDALILGCTHYPVLKETIGSVVGGGTVLIDSGEEAARVVDILLAEMSARRTEGEGENRFYVTDDPDRFARVGEELFGRGIGSVEKVTV